MPSALAREFSGVQIGQLARYYEEGRPVEGEFLVSWDEVEKFYRRLPPPAEKMLQLIADMRQAGYDKMLRAGTSLWRLVVSRSRRHGLRTDQPWIGFAIRGNDMDVLVNMDGEEMLSGLEIAFTSRIDARLKRLAEKTID